MITSSFEQIVNEERKLKEKKDKEFFQNVVYKNWEKENLKWNLEPTMDELNQWDREKLAVAFFNNYVCRPLEELLVSDDNFKYMLSSFWFSLKSCVLLVHCDRKETRGFISDYLQMNIETLNPRGAFYMLQKYAKQLVYTIQNPQYNHYYVYVYLANNNNGDSVSIYLEKQFLWGLF